MGTTIGSNVTWYAGMLAIWLVAAFLPGATFGGDTDHPSPGTSATPADMILTVHEGMLSLQAQEASLTAIFEAIGRQLHIDVVTRMPADERITIAIE